jgi:hypothetical protein
MKTKPLAELVREARAFYAKGSTHTNCSNPLTMKAETDSSRRVSLWEVVAVESSDIPGAAAQVTVRPA